MKRTTWLLFVGAPILLAACLPSKPVMPSTSPVAPQPYEQKVRFAKGESIQFADFTLQFSGQTHVEVKNYPNGFVYENFAVTADGVTQKIIWSMGTGLLDPTDFSVAGQPYLLELKSSDILEKLGEDKFVVWRQKEWKLSDISGHYLERGLQPV